MANPLIDDFLLPRTGGRRPFVRMGDEGLSEGAFVDLTARLAHVLAGQGVGRGDRVLVQLETAPLVLALFQACLRLGAVMVPTNPKFSARAVVDLTGFMAPRLVVCGEAMVAAFAALLPGIGVLPATGDERSLAARAAGAPARCANADVAEDETALILFTTGTSSGTPKPAALSHGGMRANARALVEAWRIGRDDVVFHGLPLYHIHGLVVATNVALAGGAGLVMLPRFDPALALRAGRDASVMMAPPAHYVALLAAPDFAAAAFPRMRLFISGGAIISRATHETFAQRTGRRIVERYGMTEGAMMTSAPPEGERRVGNLGRPLPGTEVRIRDVRTGALLPAGSAGEIEVRGPGLFRGYVRATGLDRGDFGPDGFFRTRDLGYLNGDGTLEYLGRASELMDLGAGPVHPAAIERRVEQLPDVLEAAAAPDAAPDGAPGLFLAVVPAPGARLDGAAIAAAVADLPATRGVPLTLAFPAALPRTPSGKVQKRTLKADLAWCLAGTCGARDPRHPFNDTDGAKTMKREQLTEKILDIKRERGWTWKYICSEIGGMSEVLVVGALLGQMKLVKPLAKKAAELFGLSEAEERMLNEVPMRGAGTPMPPTDPLIYRFYELVMVNGPAWKALIEEEFGDGIMSAIDFNMDMVREPNPKGDRVRITMSGKFLPYKYYGNEQGIPDYGFKEA